MKPHFKTLAIAILAVLIGGCMPALAAVPLRWTVETSRAATQHIDVYRGETVAVDVDVTSYGKPLDMAGEVALYVQTNGMSDSWWVYPASVSSNRVSATLAPTNYPPSAKSLVCFVGGPATNFRAAFTARIVGAPGDTPNALEPPVRSIDFSRVTVLNAPWASAADLAPVASSVASLSTTVNAWQTYWDGDDVRLTVTNYYGSLEAPHLCLEQKVSEGGTNYFKRVWDETTRHDIILSRLASIETNVAEKADRAWGFYDSHTGGYSPDGFTSISSQNVIVAPGMAYQKTVSAAGNAIWVLSYNDVTTFSGVTSNGFFRVSDGEGSTLFEIVNGDKRTVGATAASISVEGIIATIVYNVSSDTPPDLQYCTDLTSGTWSEVRSSGASIGAQPRVTWSGTSGGWTASIRLTGSQPLPTPPERMFFKATYETGGETYIRHGAPVSVEGGILCTDGIHKVRPVYNNGTITWQVVQ